MITPTFRYQLALMTFSRYAYGDHVSDPEAFRLRCSNIWPFADKKFEPLRLEEDNTDGGDNDRS